MQTTIQTVVYVVAQSHITEYKTGSWIFMVNNLPSYFAVHFKSNIRDPLVVRIGDLEGRIRYSISIFSFEIINHKSKTIFHLVNYLVLFFSVNKCKINICSDVNNEVETLFLPSFPKLTFRSTEKKCVV